MEKNLYKELGLKKNDVIIGSFQKDGQGWSEGNIPKLIKSLNIFFSNFLQSAF